MPFTMKPNHQVGRYNPKEYCKISALVWSSVAVIKPEQKQERVYLILQLPGHKPSLREETERETIQEPGTLLAIWIFYSLTGLCSATFLIQPKLTHLEKVSPTMGWALPHDVSRTSHRPI